MRVLQLAVELITFAAVIYLVWLRRGLHKELAALKARVSNFEEIRDHFVNGERMVRSSVQLAHDAELRVDSRANEIEVLAETMLRRLCSVEQFQGVLNKKLGSYELVFKQLGVLISAQPGTESSAALDSKVTGPAGH